MPRKWRPAFRLPRWLARTLSLLPVGLLVWVVIVALRQLPFDLAAIEPFDAYVLRVAGGATVAIAAAGLAFSLPAVARNSRSLAGSSGTRDVEHL